MSARAALHHANGELRLNETIIIESILSSTMSVKILESMKFGPHDAVVPEVCGTSLFTGRAEWYLDPDDPLRRGFIFR